MTYLRPTFRHPAATKNKIGYTKKDYEGSLSTLCAGCGHDSISWAIVDACYEMSLKPHHLVKLSGIGCSSKTPSYFVDNSHGFNAVHGRMPSVATGANMANKELIYIGVSGDGDSASIGMGQFVHAIRRNINVLYILMNNGCYGLTKGQNSATADSGSVSKSKTPATLPSIDLVSMAVNMGAAFAARSFSGDRAQLLPLLKAGLSHPGFALIDIISPCVTFNNTPGSTKSYHYVRDHWEVTADVDFIPEKDEITVDYRRGRDIMVKLHDDSFIKLRKLDTSWDPYSKLSAINRLHIAKAKGEVLTGLIYINPESKTYHNVKNTCDKPLNTLTEKDLVPERKAMTEINNSFR